VEKGFCFSLPKVGAHNRVPSRQLYYLVTEPLLILLLTNEKGSNSKKKREAMKKCNNSKIKKHKIKLKIKKIINNN